MRQRGFAPVLILIIILSLGVIAASFWSGTKGLFSKIPSSSPSFPTPSIDPTANWKTYSNANYSFSLKYPQNWELTDNPVADTTSKMTSDKKAHQIEIKNENGEKMILINPELPLGYGSPFTKETAEVGGKNVIVYLYGSGPTKHYSNFVISDFKNFSIDTYGKDLALDQILSTFEFTQ